MIVKSVFKPGDFVNIIERNEAISFTVSTNNNKFERVIPKDYLKKAFVKELNVIEFQNSNRIIITFKHENQLIYLDVCDKLCPGLVVNLESFRVVLFRMLFKK